MGSEYLTDSQVQGYLVHKIRLRAHGWSNFETGLSKGQTSKQANSESAILW
jgi:hypothetical protein